MSHVSSPVAFGNSVHTVGKYPGNFGRNKATIPLRVDSRIMWSRVKKSSLIRTTTWMANVFVLCKLKRPLWGFQFFRKPSVCWRLLIMFLHKLSCKRQNDVSYGIYDERFQTHDFRKWFIRRNMLSKETLQCGFDCLVWKIHISVTIKQLFLMKKFEELQLYTCPCCLWPVGGFLLL